MADDAAEENGDVGNGSAAAKAGDTDTDTDTGADSHDGDASDASSDRSLKARLRCWLLQLLTLLLPHESSRDEVYMTD